MYKFFEATFPWILMGLFTIPQEIRKILGDKRKMTGLII